MVKFIPTTNFVNSAPINLLTAINKFEQLLAELEKDIDHLPIIRFDPRYTKPINISSVDIIGAALEEDINVFLDTYTQGWVKFKFAPVISHVKNNEPTRIYYNTRLFKSSLTVGDWLENLAHELIHVYDLHSPYTFGHGDNSLKGKNETAPVKLSKVLASLAISFEHNSHSNEHEMLIW